MKARKPRILFLGHSASRNGASILLLHFLQWLQRRGDQDIEVLFANTGSLLPAFSSTARTVVWRRYSARLSSVTRREHRILRRFDELRLRMLLRGNQFDIVYANTSAAWPLARALRGRHRSLIWHIHELSYALNVSIGAERARQMFPRVSRFISVSESVSRVLSGEFQVPAERIDMVHGFVQEVKPVQAECAITRKSLLSRLNWPEDSFVIGGCGTLGWRKGTDLFLQVASKMVCDSPESNFRFLWVGGEEGGDESLKFAYEVEKFGLEKHCRRIPDTPNVSEYYCAMDVFALTSREDPFPLVMLEAGLHGVPMVCFANSGGGPEFAAVCAGLAVPYLDVAGFAAELGKLHVDASLRRRIGAEAARKVQCDHTIGRQGPKLLESIQRCLK